MIGYFEYTASAALIGHNEFTHVVITSTYILLSFFVSFGSYLFLIFLYQILLRFFIHNIQLLS
jgi:hypothetical protein